MAETTERIWRADRILYATEPEAATIAALEPGGTVQILRPLKRQPVHLGDGLHSWGVWINVTLDDIVKRCPYGQPCDRLMALLEVDYDGYAEHPPLKPQSTTNDVVGRLGHVYLTIESVRVERLDVNIATEDAIAFMERLKVWNRENPEYRHETEPWIWVIDARRE